MQAVDELRRLGYEVAAEGSDIRCRYVGLGRPDAARVRPWLEVLRADKPAALGVLHAESEEGWPPESLRCETRFGHRAARLYPFLGQRVQTLQGTAHLEQVTEARCRVVLDDQPDRAVDVPANLVRPVPAPEVHGHAG